MGTTDDEDLSDFQSAYSVSPRDSYSSFDHSTTAKFRSASNSDELNTPTAVDTDRFRHEMNLTSEPRTRVASNATTIGIHPGTTGEGTIELRRSMTTRA